MKNSNGKLNTDEAYDEPMEMIDIEKQVFRDSEGQDTITSLTNTNFLNKLRKLRRQESVKSTGSPGGSNDQSTTNSARHSPSSSRGTSVASSTNNVAGVAPNESRQKENGSNADLASMKNSVFSLNADANNKIPKSLISLFKTEEEKMFLFQSINKLNVPMDSREEEDETNEPIESNKKLLTPTNLTKNVVAFNLPENGQASVKKKKNQKPKVRKRSIGKLLYSWANARKQATGEGNGNGNDDNNGYDTNIVSSSGVGVGSSGNGKKMNRNQTDEVYHALSLMFKDSNQNIFENPDFVDKLKLYIAEAKLDREKKLDKVKLMWSIVVYILFFLMFLMVCYFVKTLFSIINHLNDNLTYSYKRKLGFETKLVTDPTVESIVVNTSLYNQTKGDTLFYNLLYNSSVVNNTLLLT